MLKTVKFFLTLFLFIILFPSYGSASDTLPALNESQKEELVRLARETIEEYVESEKVIALSTQDNRLKEVQGAFVTIHKKGALRGCIGHIVGRRPLVQTVREVAIAAAVEDPRFPKLHASELSQIDVEVSVLSVPQVIESVDDIVLGRDGVIVSKGAFQRGVFLPQVATETGWDKMTFLNQLCTQKAKLPANCWTDPAVKVETFTADVFGE